MPRQIFAASCAAVLEKGFLLGLKIKPCWLSELHE